MYKVHRLLHIGTMTNDFDIRCGIHLAQKVTTCGRVGQIDRYGSNFPNALVAIKISIKQGIKQRHDEEKHDNTLIEKRVVQFLAKDFQNMMQPLHFISYIDIPTDTFSND